MRIKETIIRRICGAVATLLTAALGVGLHSCSADDSADDADSRSPRTVRLEIVPGVPGDLNATRQYNTDTKAVKGEFINTLCVYMVDASGKVEMVIKPDFANDATLDEAIRVAASGGNLDEYTSAEFLVFPGRRSFYAFANWDKFSNADNKEAADKLLNYGLGDTFDKQLLETLVLNDPAADIDIANGKYIPMFGWLKEEEIYEQVGGANTVRIPMDRLVGRLDLSIEGNGELKEDVPVKSITVSGFADRVALFPDKVTDKSAIGYNESRVFEPAGDADRIGGAKTGATLGSVYVNETRREQPFNIAVTTSQYDGELTYNGTTKTDSLPRNYVFPLNVRVSALELAVEAWVTAPPIGVVMDSVAVKVNDDYSIEIVEGATFTITPTLPGISNVQYTWTAPADVSYDTTVQPAADGSFSATITAVPGKEITLQLDVAWQTGTQLYWRNYNIKITTVSLNDWVIPSSARWGTLYDAPAFWNK